MMGGAALVQDDEALYILNCTHNFYGQEGQFLQLFIPPCRRLKFSIWTQTLLLSFPSCSTCACTVYCNQIQKQVLLVWDLLKSQITYFYRVKLTEQSDSCTMCRQWLQWSLNLLWGGAKTSLLLIMPCCFFSLIKVCSDSQVDKTDSKWTKQIAQNGIQGEKNTAPALHECEVPNVCC